MKFFGLEQRSSALYPASVGQVVIHKSQKMTIIGPALSGRSDIGFIKSDHGPVSLNDACTSSIMIREYLS